MQRHSHTTHDNGKTGFCTFIFLFKPSTQSIEFCDGFKHLKVSQCTFFKILLFKMSLSASNRGPPGTLTSHTGVTQCVQLEPCRNKHIPEPLSSGHCVLALTLSLLLFTTERHTLPMTSFQKMQPPKRMAATSSKCPEAQEEADGPRVTQSTIHWALRGRGSKTGRSHILRQQAGVYLLS